MVFKNENLGLISVHDVTGCPPPGCQHKCVALRTEDGGKTWQEIEYPNLKGILYHLQFDEAGDLFANLWYDETGGGFDVKNTLMKSTDNGKNWEVLYESPDLHFRLVTFSFQLYKDVIYASGKNGKILKISKKGQLLETIETERLTPIWDFKAIDEKNLVLVATNAIKTSDGGKTWKTIHDDASRLIDFPSPERGLMVLNAARCPLEEGPSNGVIASTKSGGTDWTKSDLSTGLAFSFLDSWTMPDGRYLVLIGRSLYEISEQ